MTKKSTEDFHFKKFTKEERSTFSYWFYHWKAFNLTAYFLGVWKVKYLFHDIEKPFLRLFLPYKKVQAIHRRNNSHHLEYKHAPDYDYEAMVIDWECSRLTKYASPRNAVQEIIYKYNNYELSAPLCLKLINAAKKLGLLSK